MFRKEDLPTNPNRERTGRPGIVKDLLGRLGIGEGSAPSPSLLERVAEKRAALSGRFESYVAEAANRGMTKEQTQASLVAAWNANKMPRIVEGAAMRGSGVEMTVLHGQVPEDLFEHFKGRYGGVVMPGTKRSKYSEPSPGSVTLEFPSYDLPREPDPNDPTAFYIESFVLPQTAGQEQFNSREVGARLRQIDGQVKRTAGN